MGPLKDYHRLIQETKQLMSGGNDMVFIKIITALFFYWIEK